MVMLSCAATMVSEGFFTAHMLFWSGTDNGFYSYVHLGRLMKN